MSQLTYGACLKQKNSTDNVHPGATHPTDCWHYAISGFTVHEAECFCLMSGSEGADYNIIRMAVITNIDCEQEEKHTALWRHFFWAFDVRLVVGAD